MEVLKEEAIFRNLVFEGGGVKGIAYGGALTRLEEMALLENIERVAGTSAGAITATLFALGYEAEEISSVFSQTNFNDFADDDPGFLQDIFRLLKDFGWHKGDKFKDWISCFIEAKLGKADLSFAELHSLTKSKPKLKDLYIIGSNLTKQASEVYSHESTPDMKIKDAVRISMSIPFYFQAVVNSIKKTDVNLGIFPSAEVKEVLVDGGVIRNYPIDLFDDKKYLSDPKNGKALNSNTKLDSVFNYETIGFRLTDKDPLEANLQIKDITDIKSFSLSLITFMRSMASKLHVQKDDWNRTIAIDTTGVGITEFDLDQSKIDTLIDNGGKGVDSYFDWRINTSLN